jgi:transitional endoplasmic reticulum ATPase
MNNGDKTSTDTAPAPENNSGRCLGLKARRAIPKDVGRGIIRIDPRDMDALQCVIGDVVSIKGSQTSVARLMPTYMGDRGKGLAFIDGLLRENAAVGLEEVLTVCRVEAKPAQVVTLANLGGGRSSSDTQYLAQFLEGLAIVEGDRIRADFNASSGRDYRVVTTTPKGPVLINASTQVVFQDETDRRGGAARKISYEDIGGLAYPIGRIREMIELPLRHPQIFERLGIEPPKGVLLTGSPGCGKTLIARAVASETNAHFIRINGPEIIHKFYGESEAKLRNIFDEASKRAPSIIFIDEIDAIAPKRAEVVGDVEKRVVAQLLALMDGLLTRGQVIVIGATNLPDSLDPALRRPGRFDREIAITAPDKDGRLEILQIHTRSMPLAANVDIRRLSELTYGFVGADLAALCREAAMNAVREIIPQIRWETNDVPYQLLSSLEVCMEHFNAAMCEVEPSAMRDIIIEIPDTTFNDIGGLTEAKQILEETVSWPLIYGDLFAQGRVKPARGVLLAGPPGTGKTLLARALAHESAANFLSIKGPALFSKWVGESEKGIRELFRKARQVAPSIVFIDEIDSIAATRGTVSGDSGVSERVMGQLLTELDGIQDLKGVTVVAATNRPDIIDSALLRAGRFDFLIELPVPDAEARLEILKIHARHRPLADDVDLEELSGRLDAFVGAELESLVNKACLAAIREHLAAGSDGPLLVQRRHFLETIESVHHTKQGGLTTWTH